MTKEALITLSKTAQLPEEQVIYDRENNTKLVVTYESDEGEVYKETREYTIQKIRVPSAVAKRKAWKKFGDSARDPPGPNPANTYPGEIVNIQYLSNKLAEAGGKADEEAGFKAGTANPKQAVTCRTCKGAHFSLQCPFRSEMEALRSFMDSATAASDPQNADAMTKAAAQELAPELNTGRYIPPHLRAAAAAVGNEPTPGTVPERRRMDGFSIRVSNLPENISEADLRDIFSPFGEVIRIFPAKDKRTQLNRGFAFVSYATQEAAADAIYATNGLPYYHLILKVDWAQPSNN